MSPLCVPDAAFHVWEMELNPGSVLRGLYGAWGLTVPGHGPGRCPPGCKIACAVPWKDLAGIVEAPEDPQTLLKKSRGL